MIDRARALVPLSLLFLPCVLAAQGSTSRPAQSSPASVPSRPLLGEMGKATVGSAATVHTPVGSGPGMVLASSQEVLASLHLVLNSKGQMTPRIAVDISTPPQKPVTNIAASVVAQDPGDGLVLLKLDQHVPPPAVAQQSGEPTPPASPSPATARAEHRPATRAGHSAVVAQSEVAVAVTPQAPLEHSFYVSPHPSATHHRRVVHRHPRSVHRRHSHVTVVYDGP